jgi:putative peptidoglycan lipid II flippase
VKRVLNKANRRLSLGNAAMLLIVTTLLAQLLGFIRYRLVSTNFTQVDPGSTDAFFAAFQIPDFFFMTIAAGALGVAFMPVLADRLAKRDKKAVWEVTSSLLNLLGIVMLIVAIIIFVFAEPLLRYIVAPNLAPNHMQEAVTIMRFAALTPLLFTLSGILTSLQQTFGRFFFFALTPLFYNLSIMASAIIFSTAPGHNGGPGNLGVTGLGIGALVGGILQLLVACLGLIGLGYRWSPRIKAATSDFKLIMRKLPARSIDQGVDSINSIVETNRASALGQGPVSYYNFATTLMNVPVMLFGTAISTAAFPRLTERLAQRRNDLFHRDFFKVVELMIWIAAPVSVIAYFCRGYLARLLYGDVAPSVALVFGFLSVAIFARIMYTIISRYFYAQKDTATPLFVSLFVIALNIVLVYNLSKPSSYGLAGLALAQSIAAAVEVIVLVGIMFIRDRYIANRDFWSAILKIVSVTGFSVVTAFIMISLFPLNINDKGFATLGVKFGLIAGVTMLVHIGVSALFDLNEAKIVIRKARQIILRPVKIQ